jgi:hypothetical protein
MIASQFDGNGAPSEVVLRPIESTTNGEVLIEVSRLTPSPIRLAVRPSLRRVDGSDRIGSEIGTVSTNSISARLAMQPAFLKVRPNADQLARLSDKVGNSRRPCPLRRCCP